MKRSETFLQRTQISLQRSNYFIYLFQNIYFDLLLPLSHLVNVLIVILKRLEVKQVPDGTQDVPGLVKAQACSTEEVWLILKAGGKNRSVGSTNANELSSRSHW